MTGDVSTFAATLFGWPQHSQSPLYLTYTLPQLSPPPTPSPLCCTVC